MDDADPRSKPRRRTIALTKRFRSDSKKLERQGKDISKLQDVVGSLAAGGTLALKYRDHALRGNWLGWRECHLEFDWILIYRIEGSTLVLGPTGTHSDLLD